MKKLSKLTLRNVNASDVMSEKEMKNILGGGSPGGSGMCNPGEFLYSCIVNFYGYSDESSASNPGSVCAKGRGYASAMVSANLGKQGIDLPWAIKCV